MDEQTLTIRSQALGNERTVWIAPPLDASTCDTVAVFLDAELYRGRVEAPRTLNKLRQERRVGDVWAVYVSHRSQEDRWVECPCNPAFAEFIGVELIGSLCRTFPLFARVDHRVLAGMSYSGLAAAYAALRHPTVFQAVICQSASFWWNDQWLVREYARIGSAVKARFFLAVGTKETQRGLQHRPDVCQAISQREAVHAFRDVLAGLGIPVEYLEFEGGHGMTGWAETLPPFLDRALAPTSHT